jgi:hypothetical protein
VRRSPEKNAQPAEQRALVALLLCGCHSPHHHNVVNIVADWSDAF